MRSFSVLDLDRHSYCEFVIVFVFVFCKVKLKAAMLSHVLGICRWGCRQRRRLTGVLFDSCDKFNQLACRRASNWLWGRDTCARQR